MLRKILAVVSGFILWTVLWLACNALLRALGILPQDQTQPTQDTTALLALLISSVIATLAAGYTSALIAKSAAKLPVVVLGLLLLAVGVLVQTQFWRLMPLWYHLAFLALLLPACVAGGRLWKA
jgi:hypothetical protein